MFERARLRVCIREYRSIKSNYQKFIANKVLYDRANIPRIDNFMIKLSWDYFANSKLSNNPIIKNDLTKVNYQETERNKSNGLLPPESFMTLDYQGLIQNENNIPII